MWPKDSGSPEDLLGNDLVELDHLRVDHDTYIDYDDSMHSLRLRSHSQSNLTKVTAGIRTAIRDAKARNGTTVKALFVHPPSATVKRSKVALTFGNTALGNRDPRVTGMKLGGEPLSSNDAILWEAQRLLLLRQNNVNMFRLIKEVTTNLRNLKSSMRMRVHFGHLELLQYRKSFVDNAYMYDSFIRMFDDERTKGQFEKRCDCLRLHMTGTFSR